MPYEGGFPSFGVSCAILAHLIASRSPHLAVAVAGRRGWRGAFLPLIQPS